MARHCTISGLLHHAARAQLVAATLALGLPLPAWAQLTAAARQEIVALLRAIGTSGCEFQRGGTWYGAARAEAHLTKKFEYMAARNMLASAEDFIAKGATRSEMGGDAYAIRCGAGTPAEKSDVWLRHKLKSMRESAKPPY